MRTISFCGHADVVDPCAVRSWLMRTVEALILDGAACFYLGGFGGFDQMAASVLREKKQQYPHIESVLVLPYLDRKPNTDAYDSTLYPPLENVPRRFAILKRNQWMVEAADVLVAYVIHGWGGAAQTLAHARRKKKPCIVYPESKLVVL